MGRGFESFCPCQNRKGQPHGWPFLFWSAAEPPKSRCAKRNVGEDAHVIWIWKNDELIHTIGGLVEATGLQVFLDSRDGILYIVYCSDEEKFEAGEYIESRVRKSIVTVEIANDVICSDFKFIE